jgi:aspartyl/asparaginyl beta-hydroxylase (cupin superfamily)
LDDVPNTSLDASLRNPNREELQAEGNRKAKERARKVAKRKALAAKQPRSLKDKGRRFVKGALRAAVNRLLVRYSAVGDPAVFDGSLFPWVQKLDSHYETIRGELIRLSELQDALPSFHEVCPYQARISKEGFWRTGWFHGFGYRSQVMAKLCPETARLVDGVPGLESAFFSVLTPGTRIKPHRGVSKGLINYHLGLIIPKDFANCRMRVGDQMVYWEEGESVVFDDTNEHEVWNQTGEDRVVLMIQFRRPLGSLGHFVSQAFLRLLRYTPYISESKRNIKRSDRELQDVALLRGVLEAEK